MKKAILIKFETDIKITWQCPVCEMINGTWYSPSPYKPIADNLPDEQCSNCNEFVSLTLYDKKGN